MPFTRSRRVAAIGAAVGLALYASAAVAACRFWTATTTYNGRMVTCNCMDCGFGPQCNCF